MNIEEALIRAHRLAAQATGSVAIALERRRAQRDTLEASAQQLEQAAQFLRSVAEGK